ncbi:hypothetical protein K9R62_04980 (plasmid) [Borrelia hermsii]|uniref:hypothetical protein n=1 Tax=Borrelia hermsii TaxID=140 RepID=UPI001CF10D98|nr:hypothetical protein [Borrelia hermsii]UCP01993.1 hypothetical protein K9R62_04980 [Borrelia hermsii]
MKKLHIIFIFFSVFMFSCDLYEGLMADVQLGDLRDRLMSSKHVSSEPGAEDLIVSGLSSILEGIGDVGVQVLGAVADVVQGAEASEETEEQEEAEEQAEEAKEAKEEGSSDEQKEEVNSQGVEVAGTGAGSEIAAGLSVKTESVGTAEVVEPEVKTPEVSEKSESTKTVTQTSKGTVPSKPAKAPDAAKPKVAKPKAAKPRSSSGWSGIGSLFRSLFSVSSTSYHGI